MIIRDLYIYPKLPKDAGTYITNLKERAAKELGMPVIQENALFASLNSISSLGDEVTDYDEILYNMIYFVIFTHVFYTPSTPM